MTGDGACREGERLERDRVETAEGAAEGAAEGSRLGSWWLFHHSYLTSQRSQFSETFMRSFPLTSKPFDHSSAAADPRLNACSSSFVTSSTCGL
jgi:hypothetical protein